MLVFLKVLWYAMPTSVSGKSHRCGKLRWIHLFCIMADQFIFSLLKMTFVSKGMAQNSGKSHLCNVKYGKLYDGEQQVLVFLKVL